MNRSNEPTIEELLALRDAQLAAITALSAENTRLSSLVAKLEAELALARMHRYAPRSEKSKDRLLNEAEQAAAETAAGISMCGRGRGAGHGLFRGRPRRRRQAGPQTLTSLFAA